MGTIVRGLVASLRLGGLTVLVATLVVLLVASEVSAATGWTGPDRVGPAAYCDSVSAAIDAKGGFHVVAECGGRLRYSTGRSGGAWSTTTFPDPGKTFTLSPQIAIDGDRVYIASSRLAPTQDTCGGPGIHLGVYYRWRQLPSGTWSTPIRLGEPGDDIQSFRVVGRALYATVTSGSDLIYETNATGKLKRYRLPDARGSSSLRVGNDGRARVAYEATHGLRYGVFNGSGFTTSIIPGTTQSDGLPVLVLDGSNAAHVLWSHLDYGCSGSVYPIDGTYYATNRGGAWTAPSARRFTGRIGPMALTVDTASGRVHALVGGYAGLRYFTKAAAGTWSSQTLTSTPVQSVSLKLDPGSSRLLAVYARQGDTLASSSVYEFTKP
jgi:hypothetical protein